MEKRQIISNFLTNSSETGRHIVFSIRTKKTYFVEPIGNGRSDWGDVDPVSKKITGSYGDKYTGSVTEKESIIKEENGFKNITMVEGSPYWVIEQMDAKYPTVD
jgi:hypothetical protein